MQNAGKNVLISLGGDPNTFTSSHWQNYANDVPGLVQQVVAFVTANRLNGVDIDYEDDNGFSTRDKNGNYLAPPPYDGAQLLIDLTNGLAQQLPPGSIITHAPQPPYFYPDAGYNPPGGTAPYTRIWEAAGNNISWVNCQFYNNSNYDDGQHQGVLVQHHRPDRRARRSCWSAPLSLPTPLTPARTCRSTNSPARSSARCDSNTPVPLAA